MTDIVYTESLLDAHSAAIDEVSTAFDSLTDAFSAFTPEDPTYTDMAGVYLAYCECFRHAVSAYSTASSCALRSALKDRLEVAKGEADLMNLETKVAHMRETGSDAEPLNAKAQEWRNELAGAARLAERLEQRARSMAELAGVLMDIVQHCELNARVTSGETAPTTSPIRGAT